METPWHLVLMACLYLLAGVLHFIYPRVYLKIIPPWIPGPKPLVYLSGLLEIAFGAALFFPATRETGLYGILALLFVFIPVHIHMLRDRRAAMGLPAWFLALRIPLQGLLIYWAFSYL